ncbi:hypothetical protein C453_04764 [Haloferax elongans ATCC BAA-1513]|uniref:Lipoprotein n=1 Tax=Haloferax elongans ATCC BAA-1513 TaxID=1230453 RepID=M0HVD1_HALEO|nr:hypothetical protein C453_04764 [Haloferax elongans ATCC BAA-1513]
MVVNRRALLTGTASLCAALAGCTSDDATDDGTETTTTASTPTPTPPEPRLVDNSLSPRHDPECPQGGAAQASYISVGVLVEGCLWGANGCAIARLGRATYDPESDVASLLVETVEDRDPDEACTEALKPVGYEARLQFENGLPGELVVEHDDVDGRREIARIDFDDA